MREQANTLIHEAKRLCLDWWEVHNKLLNESDQNRKEQLLYREVLLERLFKKIANDYHSHYML